MPQTLWQIFQVCLDANVADSIRGRIVEVSFDIADLTSFTRGRDDLAGYVSE